MLSLTKPLNSALVLSSLFLVRAMAVRANETAAAFSGENSMRKRHVSVPVLAIAAGILLFLVALRTVMETFETRPTPPPDAVEPSLRLAVSPLALPVIVTPYGVAAVIICVTLAPDYLTKGANFAGFAGSNASKPRGHVVCAPDLEVSRHATSLPGLILLLFMKPTFFDDIQ